MENDSPVVRQSCPNSDCQFYGKTKHGNIKKNGIFKLKRGRRQRYCCSACGKTFCSTTATPYHRIQHSRNTFDDVCYLSVEGLSKSAIARIKKLTWNTVSRWLERACVAAGQFNDHKLNGYPLQEIQADEIRSFMDRKKNPIWLITLIEVWSRLWPSYVVGRRSYRNIRKLFRNTLSRAELTAPLLITTDGFEPYGWVIKRLFGSGCVYGQVIKKRRKNRVVSIDRKLLIGTDKRLEEALCNSEDSETLNTSFIERHNLTLRRSCPYLQRRTNAHARKTDRLEENLELLQCHYNFIRPHMALKFGRILKTPTMQAGLASRPLTFREIFLARYLFALLLSCQCSTFGLRNSRAA